MANVKLFGLVLIITTSILALAAIATQTNRIRLRSFSNGAAASSQEYPRNHPGQPIDGISGTPEPINHDQAFYQPASFNQPSVDNSIQFVSIPIVLPLCFAGLLGMMLWFTPISSKPSKSSGRRSSSRRRR